MSDAERPDPDALLKAVTEGEQKAAHGKLRIFLGMSAGVGKTYAMLSAAQDRLRENCDVVIGVVETHGRTETEFLTQGLPLIPRKRLDYRGTALAEMDLDAVLDRKPQLVLVDELAHTNVPGSRHRKRYQDVLELIDNGIDVYTTLNVQHLESRKELVEKMAGITVRETVPDSILDRADQVSLVDLTAADLLKRLQEGKVYLGDKAERATEHFFRRDTLTALREIALRITAERVDHELQSATIAGIAPLHGGERLMVAVSHSPFSAHLIRATRRLAFGLEAPWIAVNVDTGVDLNDEDQAQLNRNITLALELGAEVINTADPDIPAALRRIARQRGVTQVIVGRPSRRFIRDVIEGGSLLDRLVRENWDIDVHVIRQDEEPPHGMRRLGLNFRSGLTAYWNTIWALVVLLIIGNSLEPFLGYRAVGFVLLLGVLVIGVVGTLGPVLFAATLTALAWNYFFIPPKFTFLVSKPEDGMMLIMYFIVAAITGGLTNRIKRRENMIREREQSTNLLYEVLQDISASREKDDFLRKVTSRVGEVLNGDCSVLIKTKDNELKWATKYHSPLMNEKDTAVAQWVFDNKKPAGWSTETLAESRGLFLPMVGNNETVGVFVYHPETKRKLSQDQLTLLYSVARRLALSLERHFLDKRVRDAERLEESEKIHQTLLNSISHELRTPLSAIIGSASALTSDLTTGPKKALADELLQATDRLNRIIENLLDMSRLSAGAMTLKREWNDLNDLIGVTLKRVGTNLRGHNIILGIPEKMPLVEVDFRFFEHALTNILINASTYTPVGSTIWISAKPTDSRITLSIEDNGPGIPEEHLESLFNKFFRVPGSPAGGTGLGLSIVRSIVELHGGTVRAENRRGGGARFVIELPSGTPPRYPEEPSEEESREA